MANSPEIDLAHCTVTLKTERHYEPEYEGRFRYLNVAVQHPKFGELAKMRCLLLSRRNLFKICGDFSEMMDEESEETKDFSEIVFDRYGVVRPWLIDGGARSGLGCWGKELNTGDMVYIMDLTVEKKFRKRGVGTFALQKLLQSPRFIKNNSTVYCLPWPPTDEFEMTMNKKSNLEEIERVIKFFRKNGFRRIGRTAFFGYSPDPNHPSRKIPLECDPGQIDFIYDSDTDAEPEQYQHKYPLHTAINNNNTAQITSIIASVHTLDPSKIHQPDKQGFTPIDVAVDTQNLFALRILLDLGAVVDLHNGSNSDQMKPLERLEDKMRRCREGDEMYGMWEGYPTQMLACEYHLKKALGMPLIADTEEEYIVKRRLGCTCGSCTDQWFSPRMRALLQAIAKQEYHKMLPELENFTVGKPLPLISSIELRNSGYLPRAEKMYKSFYEGYCSVFLAIELVLRNSIDVVPSPEHIRAQVNGQFGPVKYFLEHGGLVEHALYSVVDRAMRQSVHADSNTSKSGASEIPQCANDLAFQQVRNRFRINVATVGTAGEDFEDYMERIENELEAGEFDDDLAEEYEDY